MIHVTEDGEIADLTEDKPEGEADAEPTDATVDANGEDNATVDNEVAEDKPECDTDANDEGDNEGNSNENNTTAEATEGEDAQSDDDFPKDGAAEETETSKKTDSPNNSISKIIIETEDIGTGENQ